MNEIFMLFPILFPIICGAVLYFLPIRKARTRNIFVLAVLLISTAAVWMLAIFTPEGELEIMRYR